MKNKRQIVFLLLPLIFINSVCPKKLIDPYSEYTYYFTINGTFNNVSETIKLGDTLKLEVRMPDTVTAKNALGQTRSEKVNSLQMASYSYRLYQVDSVKRTILIILPPSNTLLETSLSAGTGYNYSHPYLETSRPYNSILNIIPKIKGLFYIEIVPQSSYFKINDNFEGLVSVNFNVPDRHYNLVVNNTNQGMEFLASANDNNAKGFGMYAFRVN